MLEIINLHLNNIYPYALIPLLSGLFILINAINFVIRDYKTGFARYFFYLCVSIAIWNLSSALLISSPEISYARIYSIFYWVGWFFVPVLFLNLVAQFLIKGKKLISSVMGVYILLCIIAIVSDYTHVEQNYFGYYPRIDFPLNYIVIIPYIITCIYGLIMLYLDYNSAEKFTRKNLLMLLWLGACFGFVISITELFPLLSDNIIQSRGMIKITDYLISYSVFGMNILLFIFILYFFKHDVFTKIPFLKKHTDLKVIIFLFLPWGIFDVYLFINYTYTIYPISTFGIIIAVFFFSYAILKYRLFDIAEFVKQLLIYTFVSSIFIFLYLFLYAFFSDQEINLLPFILFALLVLFLFNPINIRLQRHVSRKVFHHKYDYQNTIRETSRQLVAILDYDMLLNRIKNTIVDTMEASTFAMLIYNYSTDDFEVAISHGLDLEEGLKYNLNDQVIQFIILYHHEIYKHHFEVDAMDGDYNGLIPFFRTFDAELIMPMSYKNVLRGILCLGKKETGQMYYQRDVELLQVLLNQAVIAIDNARLYEMAIRDELTGLFIIRFFNQRIIEEINRSIRTGQEFSLLMMDIDHFKSVNDNHGHQVGDQLLRDIAYTIKENVRNLDIITRYGGEEFAVILPRADNNMAYATAERIRESISKNVYAEGIKRTISIGITTTDVKDVINSSKKIQNMSLASRNRLFERFRDEIIKHADEALYAAKREGRNRVVNNGIKRLAV